MKLLLTSSGLKNQTIAAALFELVGKPAAETSIAFIPTSMNVEDSDKGWFIDDLANIKKQGCRRVDVVDISALPREVWLPRLEKADVLFFSGGNTAHLMRWLNESGLVARLPELLQTRVYAGISAGSIATNPTIELSSPERRAEYARQFGYTDTRGLNLVQLYVRPHLNSPHFPTARREYLVEIAKDLGAPLYGIDDNTALKIVDGNVEVVSEGEYVVL
ncbi:MAG: Type 1 glutamine amidotransferase-like domain-containing protein [Candidatus Kerfeldbacteria bacterium]|nr:Type 1 glutamine amidotransferase-like domain-containing protein [Candidatus Kerfeldbacteria bacterium]